MWKKIYCTFFLLFGLLSLFSCGYAITLNDIQNEVDNFIGFSDNRFTTFVHGERFCNAWEYVTSHTDTSLYNKYMIWVTNSNGLTGYVTLFNDTGLTGYYSSRSNVDSTKRYTLYCVPNMTYRCNITISFNKANSGIYNGYYISLFETGTDKYTIKNTNDEMYFCNIDEAIYTSYDKAIINNNSDIYTFYNYPQTFFNWSNNSNLSTIQVSGFGTNIPYLQWSSSSILLGTINQYSNLNIGRSWVDRYVYRNGNWEFLDQRQISHWGRIDNLNDIGSIYLESNINNISGAIYVLHLEPNDTSQFNDFNIPFYNASSNDIIQNGTLILSDTFSGDFNNNYQQQINNQQIQQQIQDVNDTLTDTSGIDDTVSGFLSGDIDTWSSDLGYSPIENPFSTFLFDLAYDVYDALTVRHNYQLDLNHHDTTGWVINTDDFITPDSSIKTLITCLLVFLYLYGNYKFFYHLYTLVETANIDKAIATLGTDEFYDSDIM